MARPRKQNTNIMQDEIVEVKENAVTNAPEPVITESKKQENIVPDLEVEIVRPKVQEQDKARMPTPICDIAELTEEDKQVLVEKKIRTILLQSQIPCIPALVKYKEPETTAIPPMYALVDFDHRFVNEGWEFYKTNVRNPYVKDYLQLVAKVMNKPNKIYTRLVLFNYE